jgi:hypothetical protein
MACLMRCLEHNTAMSCQRCQRRRCPRRYGALRIHALPEITEEGCVLVQGKSGGGSVLATAGLQATLVRTKSTPTLAPVDIGRIQNWCTRRPGLTAYRWQPTSRNSVATRGAPELGTPRARRVFMHSFCKLILKTQKSMVEIPSGGGIRFSSASALIFYDLYIMRGRLGS